MAPAAANITGVGATGLFEGDYVVQTANNDIQFDAQTDGTNVQYFQFTSDLTPVRWNLFIDGYQAVYEVVFSSMNVESTSDIMPFDLLPTGAAQSVPVKPAPAFNKTGLKPHLVKVPVAAPKPTN